MSVAQQRPAVVKARAELLKGSSACEKALAKLGSVQAQRLLEAYARLQQLQGLPAAVPAGSSPMSEITSKVPFFVPQAYNVCWQCNSVQLCSCAVVAVEAGLRKQQACMPWTWFDRIACCAHLHPVHH